MLRIGLTGGIGSGKSTVAARLADLGAVVVDADQVARQVVEPGTPPLAAIEDRFGPTVLTEAGQLDRPALGRVVFGDRQALQDLEAITHPAIWARSAELMDAAADDAVVVHDMPLLVEKAMTAEYHLVVVVGASEATRVRRLVEHRGMPEEDARSRMSRQVGDEARRAAADVWLDNEGTPAALQAVVDRLWHERLVPFEENLRHGIRVRRPEPAVLVAPDPTWPAQAARLAARLRHALGEDAVAVEHIGSTAVPDLLAKDVIDLQVGVRSLAGADEARFVERMLAAGFPRVAGVDSDGAKDGSVWAKRFHGGCDPARVVHVHVREVGSPGWEWALAFRDWLRSEPAAREEYAAEKLRVAAETAAGGDYAAAKEPWFDAVHPRVRAWASTWRTQ